MVSPAEDSEDETEEAPKALAPEAWRSCPVPLVFKDVQLEWCCMQEATPVHASEEARYGVGERSFVRLRVEPSAEASATASLGVVEFFLGEESGYQWIQEDSAAWTPPQELLRVEIPKWLTEAALCLRRPNASARFRTIGCPEAEVDVKLLAVQRGEDLLGDGEVLLRHLHSGDGAPVRDAGTVRASWRVWFQRNLELIFSTGDLDKPDEAVNVVIDEDELMAALQLGLKHVQAGGHGLLSVVAEWGIGQLLPSGGPALRKAAVWIELCVHEVHNPPLPGEFKDTRSCLEFAELRKSQGNRHLAAGDPAGLGRASRRYEEGIAALAGLKEAPPASPVLLAALRRNAALALLRRERWADAVVMCSEVLKEGPDAKALFRRGAARLGLLEFDGAVEDLREALAMASAAEKPAIRQELAKVQARRKDWQQEQRRAFQGVFDKMTYQDQEREKREREEEERQQEEERKEKERQKEAAKPLEPAVEEAKLEEDRVNEQVSALVDPPAAGAAEPKLEEEKDFRDVVLPKRPQETGITALMPPPGSRISQPPPKVENYQVPSFLRKKQQKGKS